MYTIYSVWAAVCAQPDRHGLERREMAARASEANPPWRGRFQARKVLGWPKICKLAHAFMWEYSCERLKLGQLLGQLGVFLTSVAAAGWPRSARRVGDLAVAAALVVVCARRAA